MEFDRQTIDLWSPEDVARFKRPVPIIGGAEAVTRRLVAAGDSWFDYLPGADIIDCLRHFHHFEVDNHSRAGDTLENMVFGAAVPAVLDSVRAVKPKALLFSAGGNDVAGDEFETYLNHQRSGLPLVRPDVINYMIDTVFRDYLLDLIAAVAQASPATSIVAHGYGHTKATGKGVINLFGLFRFVGPWLLPALLKKGIHDAAAQDACVLELIDRYNGMLKQLAAENDKFVYVDLRPMINKDTDWANELHLRNSAFARVSDAIAAVVNALP